MRFRVQDLGSRHVGAIGAVLSRFLVLLQIYNFLPHSGCFSLRQGDLWFHAGEEELLFKGLFVLRFVF